MRVAQWFAARYAGHLFGRHLALLFPCAFMDSKIGHDVAHFHGIDEQSVLYTEVESTTMTHTRQRSGSGWHMDSGTWIPLLLHADDIVLIADSPENMQ